MCTVQYVGMYENEEYGRMDRTLKSLMAADPDFGEVQYCRICFFVIFHHIVEHHYTLASTQYSHCAEGIRLS